MGRRIHKKVWKRKPGERRGKWVWCDTRMKTRWSGLRCDCGVRWQCL